jgi:glycosyltransferase involved in cell wall biosynthesis
MNCFLNFEPIVVNNDTVSGINSHECNILVRSFARVSIIIPVYNGSQFIRQAVESALNQTYPNCEVIVVDDGSVDDTQKQLEVYGDRIVYFRQPNQGVSAARNQGIKLAGGKFLVFLDADDFITPDKVAHQITLFDNSRRIGLVNSGWYLTDAEGQVLQEIHPWLNAPQLNLKTLLFWKPVFPAGMMFRRDWVERVGAFDTSLSCVEDVDLALRLLHAGCGAVWFKQSTAYYRRHAGNKTGNVPQQNRHMEMVLNKFFLFPDLPTSIRQIENDVRFYTAVWHSWKFFLDGCHEAMIENLRLSLRYAHQSPSKTLFVWLNQFASYTHEPELLLLASPYIVKALDGEHVDGFSVQTIMEWWNHMWLRCFYHQTPVVEHSGIAHIPFDLHIKFARLALIYSSDVPDLSVVSRFWNDVSLYKERKPDERYHLASLYLVICGRALLEKHWWTFLHSFLLALSCSFHWQAIFVWWRFFRAGAKHLENKLLKKFVLS